MRNLFVKFSRLIALGSLVALTLLAQASAVDAPGAEASNAEQDKKKKKKKSYAGGAAGGAAAIAAAAAAARKKKQAAQEAASGKENKP